MQNLDKMNWINYTTAKEFITKVFQIQTKRFFV